jgi:hypothetical protein
MIAFMAVILLMTWYSMWNLQGKIHCQFHKKDRTVIDKKIKITDKEVRFDGGTYEINPKRFSIKWFKLWSIFPYPMLFSEWYWDTDQPVDPTTRKNTWDSPEARSASNSEKDWRGFNMGVDTQLGKKQGMLEKYLPWVTVGLVVIALFLIYQQSGKMGIIEQQIQSLGGLINSIKVGQ